MVGSALLHAGDEEADGGRREGVGLGPSGEAIGGVEAKLDADVGGDGGETVYWATWTLLVLAKAPGATTLTVAEADLVVSVLLVAVTVT